MNSIKSFFATVTRNPLSLLGTAITTAAAVLFASLFVIQTLGFRGGAYLGILTFIVIPSIFVFGLILIPIGIARAKRKGTDPRFPLVDLNNDHTRKLAVIFLGATLVNIVILAVATYEGVEVMDSTEFCGKACHSVMAPEFTTYSRSPHSRVQCVECHIGPGAGWFVKSKLSGSWQLVSVTLDLYPRPIPTPVHNLRPARETCEQCHWPTKFVGDRLRVKTHFQEDEANTETKTVLVLRVGGRKGGDSQGIHWHVDPGVAIRYRSDETREKIYEVELTKPDGTHRTYRAPEADSDEGKAATSWRTMDCVDCHNRPTHVYKMPVEELDQAIDTGKIDRSLPWIRREGLKALEGEYPSHDEARAGIAKAIGDFYADKPELAEKAKAASAALGDIWCTNVWPSMNIKWGTYPNHIGHMDTPGCFRCHSGEMTSTDGHTIEQDCSTCHAILAMDEENPAILTELQP